MRNVIVSERERFAFDSAPATSHQYLYVAPEKRWFVISSKSAAEVPTKDE